MYRMLGILGIVLLVGTANAGELTPAQQGEKWLTTKSYNPPVWSMDAYRNLWKQWPQKLGNAPADYDRAVADYYGLHPANYANDNLPMGLRKSSFLFYQGLSIDCLVCHSGSIAGKSYIGMGNASLDIQSLFDDLNRAQGRSVKTPFTFCQVRGTNEAGAMGVYLLGLREPDMSLRGDRLELGLHDDLCEDVPAWWLLKKKKTMYYTGGADARSVRSLMQFMMAPSNGATTFKGAEPEFQKIQSYLLSLEAPKYPLPIDARLAERGQSLFVDHCARCHGQYGATPTYPNKIVALDDIGTDPTRFHGITDEYGHYYNKTWFSQEQAGWFFDGSWAKASRGYQAPPLDGIWATAPYLHNGSVPTLHHLLKSSTRPTVFTRSFRTDMADYDAGKVGWKVEVLPPPPTTGGKGSGGPPLPPHEERKIYNTRLKGRGNQGHTYGDALTDEERTAVIEYLKTL